MDEGHRVNTDEDILRPQENARSEFGDEKRISLHDAICDEPQDEHEKFIEDNSWLPKSTTTSDQLHITQFYNDALPQPPVFDSEVEPPPPPNRSIYPLQTQPGYGITVVPYDPDWPAQFRNIQSHLHNLFTTATPPAPYTTIEHIGSTSIPGLAAKPNIDVLVTVPSRTALNLAIEALEWETPSAPSFTRYTRIPNGGGIQGRESFKLYVPSWSPYYFDIPERSVYLIDESGENHAGRVQIRCYRSVRETLRDPVNEDLLREYGEVKVELGRRVYADSITYSALKDGVVRKVLKRGGWTDEEVDEKEKLSERVWEVEEPPY